MTSPSAARWTAEGKTSLEDWPMLTWSLACAPSPARLASTSLAFMLEEVPEPVWKTSTGNWSSCSPAATASPAAAMRSARAGSSPPSSPLTRAAAAFSRPSQRTTGTGTRSPDTGKLSTALVVSPPQSCSVTSMPPSKSLSAQRIGAPGAGAGLAGDPRDASPASRPAQRCGRALPFFTPQRIRAFLPDRLPRWERQVM